MTATTATGGGRSALADELRADAPELAAALDQALAELTAAPLAPPDAPLAELLGLGSEPVALSRWRSRVARRIAVAGGAVTVVVAATTGLAAASVLPAPVQRAVAAVAARVGIDLPDATPPLVHTASRVLPSSAAPGSTATSNAATSTAPASTARTAPPAASGPGTAPASSRAAIPPAATAQPTQFATALAAFRSCVSRGSSECTPPDPAAYGLPSSVEPSDVAAFRRAVVDYFHCLSAQRANGVAASSGSASGSGANRGSGTGARAIGTCTRPLPSDFGFRPPTGTLPPRTTVTIPTPTAAQIAAFRQAVLAYIACLRASNGNVAAAKACAFPDLRAYGLRGWPSGVIVPPRPSSDQGPSSPTGTSQTRSPAPWPSKGQTQGSSPPVDGTRPLRPRG